ncbi:Rne/Rng family ribonuclease, partial [Streptomyces sp. NPDC006879]|uniref:Rne/Rng family ribonuclease n=1 Tax=Streptomyces sp. NPDC006879 TaxID=3364767 RepID=UPI0036B5C93D
MLENESPEVENRRNAAENSPSDTLPPRRRRRAASRPAGPPVAGDNTAENAAEKTTTENTAEVAAPVVAEEASAAPARTRRRAVRKTASPVAEEAVATENTAEVAAPVVAEEASAAPARTRRRAVRKTASPVAEEAVATENTAEVAAPVVAEEASAAPARTRRRAVRKATSAAPGPAAAEPAAEQTAEAAQEAPAATRTVTVADVLEGPKSRSRRRATRASSSAESATEPVAEEPSAKPAKAAKSAPTRARRATRPVAPVFQAPVFTEPMFQTPETAAAAAAAAAELATEATEEEVVEEVETAPAPQPAARRRRRRGAAAEPEPAAEPVAVEPEHAAVVSEESGDEEAADYEDAEESGERPTRRRRRGGRRRRRGDSPELEESTESEENNTEDQAEPTEQDEDELDEDEGAALGSSSSRRRRRRRRRSGDTPAEADTSADDPERTVVKVREPRPKAEPSDEVQSIKGSTRLEAKKQRRREGREQGRRRVPIITEAEFLARREAVERVMVVRQHGDRTQIGVLEDNVLVEHYVNKEQATSYVGNVYLGKVQNVLPSMEAAFVDIGKGRNAVLYAGEVNFEALGMANGPRRIESALKSGQSVLVQVTKDPIGHKGARLTSQVSLPGRYLVYVPEGSMTGISRKLPDTERARLKSILKKIVPEDAGVIVRTAAEGASENELRRDVERLQAQWEEIQKKSKMISTSSPSLLYGEPDMTVRVVRDIFNEDFSKVIVSGDEAWETIHGYVSHVAPDLADRLSKWTSEVDVFATYRIDEQLMKALDRKVWLPSGGSLVIDKTEAMIVVDVNTGKFTGQGGNLEETVTRNNLEAAEEIVRQLRLRDLGGIVVIDFIDMVLESNRDLVLRRLLECLGRDRTKHQVAEVTSLGLVQMTRKRVGQGLLESFSETCVHCNGRGVIVHMEQPAAAGGGGKRSKKRGRGGEGASGIETDVVDTTEAEVESEAEVAAEAAAPIALPAPDFMPDEELYGSVAEAEAAAGVGGGRRSRRRATRKVSAPAGSPKAVEAVEAAPMVVEPEPEPVVEAEPVAEPEPVVEAAPKGRSRRRATRKVSAPAGSPKAVEAVEAAPVV